MVFAVAVRAVGGQTSAQVVCVADTVEIPIALGMRTTKGGRERFAAYHVK